MESSHLHPRKLSALVIAGSLVRHTSVRAEQRRESIFSYQGMPFELYPQHEDAQGRLGIRLASLLEQAEIDTRLLLSSELHETSANVLPKDRCQTFSSVQSLRRQVETLIAERKPDLIFVGTRNVHYTVWRFVDDSERFTLEIESLPDAQRFVSDLVGEESHVVQFDCADSPSPDELSSRASALIAKAQTDLRAERDARHFGTLGVMNSFQAEDFELPKVV